MDDTLPDERLSLIFACCHPALSLESQVALTLRLVGGLTTEEIARSFLVPEPTMAQRLSRAKGKVRAAAIPIRVPPGHLLLERLRPVHAVLYLAFNQGYGPPPRDELLDEAIRLGKLLAVLMPDDAESLGLLALMLLHDARRETRLDASGDLVLLADQDRARWNRDRIDEGRRVLDRAIGLRRPGPYQVQAAIASLHADEPTDWQEIAVLYGRLAELSPSPVIELNRAVAVAMAEGPERGLELIEPLEEPLDGYHLMHSARADLLRRLERTDEAAEAYRPRARPRAQRERAALPLGADRGALGHGGKREVDRLGRARRMCDSLGLELPAGIEDHDGTAEQAGIGDLGERAPGPADRDRGVRGGDDGQVAGMADAGCDRHVDPFVRGVSLGSRDDSDRPSSGRLRAAAGGGHDLVEPAGDDRRAMFGEQAADLLGRRLGLGAAPDHRDLQAHGETLAETMPG